MILKWKDYLKDKVIVLGSTSHQRKKLLEDIDIDFKLLVMDSKFPENLEKQNPLNYVQNTCKGKFDSIINRLNDVNEKENINEIIIKENNCYKFYLVVADTICVKKGVIIEKVNSEKEAFDLIKSYSENEIEVITSHILCYLEKDHESDKYIIKCYKSFDVITNVIFHKLDDETVKAYIKLGEWINRAGAIAIQLNGKLLVKEIKGCYSNIVGLSVSNFSFHFDEMITKILNENK